MVNAISPKRCLLYAVMVSVAFLSSCKGGNNSSVSTSEDVSSAPAEEKTTNSIKPYTPRVSQDQYIGKWKVPVTSQLITIIQLYYNPKNRMYYTKEQDAGTARQDSLGVKITKKNQEYHIEYTKRLLDNYAITNYKTVIWRCTGYSDVTCNGEIDMERLASTYEQYRSTPSAKTKSNATKSISEKDKARYYEWSKHFVKVSVFNPESLSFPNVNAVKVSPKLNGYIIEYKVSGKDLYNKSVVYSASIVFVIDEKGEPAFCSIAI